MTRFLRQAAALLHAFIAITLLATPAFAETPFPTIHEPSDESKKCIQPEDEMRRNHMNYILHERDETMHEGIRGEPEGLSSCIDCHVEPNENGEIAGIESDEHFCNACHQYASVQIDCFQCHADRPQKYIERGASEHSAQAHGQAHDRQSHDNKTSSLHKQLQQTLAAGEANEGATK